MISQHIRRKLAVLLVGALITLLAGMGIPAKEVLAAVAYTANVNAVTSQAGMTTELDFTTSIPANSVLLKKVVLSIPSGYTITSNLPAGIGTLLFSVPTEGITSQLFTVANNQPVVLYKGNTNTYEYTVMLDPSARTITLLAQTGTRSTSPYTLNLTFSLFSGLLTNPNPTVDTNYTWTVQGQDFNGQSVSLPSVTTSVTGTSITPSAPVVSVGGAVATSPVAGTSPTSSTPSTLSPTIPSTPTVTPLSPLVLNPTPVQTEAAAASSDVAANTTAVQTIQAADGVAVTLSPRVVALPITVTIAMGQITSPPQDAMVHPLDPVLTERQFGPSGTVFNTPVTLTFPYGALDLTGYNPQELAIYRWSETLNDWLKVGGVVDTSRKTISVPVYHFSTYALMVDTHQVPQRLAGTDRFMTAVAVADAGWPSGATDVVLTNGYSFPDALAGVPLAFKLNAPILLTESGSLPDATWAEIQKLKAKNVTILGGEGAVSAQIESTLNANGLSVTRYGGNDRYQTAVLIGQALSPSANGAVLVSGDEGHFSDALAISSWAAYHGYPILYVAGQGLSDATTNFLKTLNPGTLVVAGGEGAVPKAAVAAAQQLLSPSLTVSRYAGADRFSTATAIAGARALGLNPSVVYVTTGLDFADALVAGNLAAHQASPLVLVANGIPSATQDYFKTLAGSGQIPQVVDIGGVGAVSSAFDQWLAGI